MSLRRTISKLLYPLIMKLARKSSKGTIFNNAGQKQPAIPFNSLKLIRNDKSVLNPELYKGKKLMLVNTASACGFTDQYQQLQELYEQYKGKLEILAFPANDFNEQEKGSDKDIAQFCQLNFGVTFPLMAKSVVVKSENQNEVYKWLCDPQKNGWNNHQPDWNFSKYLVNEQGVLTHYFGPAVSPLSNEVINALKQ